MGGISTGMAIGAVLAALVGGGAGWVARGNDAAWEGGGVGPDG